MTQYLAILERAQDGSWSAYVPDLPGCTSAAASREEVARNIRDAIEVYLDELRAEGSEPPRPSSLAEVVSISK